MKYRRWIATLLLSIFAYGQFGLVGVAMAAKHKGTGTSAPTATSSSPSPSPDPSASPTPSASPDPSASPSPDPSASPTPSASPDPSASPSPSPAPGSGAKDAGTNAGAGAGQQTSTNGAPDNTGAQGCQGVVPAWVFDTTTGAWVAADQSSFSCDSATGYWLSPEYYYNTRTGWYEIVSPTAVAASSDPQEWVTAPNVIHTELGDLTVGSPDYQTAEAMGLLGPGGIVISGTGAGSTNDASVSNSGQNWVDLTNLVNVINTLQSAATSGNVTANSDTNVGSSVTGAASVLANLLNLLASAWSWSNGDLNFFSQTLCDVGQTCNGDVNLNPTQTVNGDGGSLGGSADVTNTGAGSSNSATDGTNSNLNVNAQTDGNIVNNVNLNATSGDASADSDTNAGNVASGDATAEVNIINLINSFINSGSSFFGVLNIFGTLNGDILFPNGFLNGAVASGSDTPGAAVSGTGADSSNTAGVSNSGNTTINNAVDNSADNNISTTADTGDASANMDTGVGSVTTGAATTTQGLFNLANQSIFGDNAVLVIVNVAGHWIGKIMDLPSSDGATTSGLLTDNATATTNSAGVSNTGADSNNAAAVDNNANATVNQSSVGTITNNVNVSAQSGNASADKDTNAGDVSTGNASAMSSVANIFNSVLNVQHWFGVLVINVFGSWTGDVGDNTAAGNTPGTPAPTAGDATALAATPQVGLLGLFNTGSSSNNGTSGDASNGQVAGAATVAGGSGNGTSGQVLTAAAEQPAPLNAAAVAKGKDASILFVLSAVVMLVAGALISAERRLKKIAK